MAEFESIALAITILFFLCTWLWYKNRSSSPAMITDWPVIGMLPGLFVNRFRVLEYFTDVLIKNGGSFEFKGPWFPSFNFTVTSNFMDVNHILCRHFIKYEKGSKEIFLDSMGDGILNSDSDSWNNQRKMLMSLMHSIKFERRADEIVRTKLEKSLIPILEQLMKLDAELDLQDVFQRFNYDTMSLLVLGLDPNSLAIDFPEVPSKVALNQVKEVLFYRQLVPSSFWKLKKWLQIGEEKKMREALIILDDHWYNCISSKREKLRTKSQVEEDQEEEFDLLTAFMAEEAGKSDKFLRDTVSNIIVAGTDTVSAGLSWFFWVIATNPSVESKILAEIQANSPKNKDKNMIMLVSGEKLNRYIYLDAVLSETLRLYPPVPFNHRTAIKPDGLPCGHRRVPVKTKVFINFYAVARMKDLWGEDCLEFKPERWISKQGEIIQAPGYKSPAFSAGPRTCLGKDLSFIQMKMVAIAILWKYQVQVVKEDSVSPSKNPFVLHMKNGLKVKLKKRCLENHFN